MEEEILTQVSEFDYILHESFLSMYTNENEDLKLGYDAYLDLKDTEIYILHEVIKIDLDANELSKSDVARYSSEAVNIMIHRHGQLQKKFEKSEEFDETGSTKRYFVGLASLVIERNDRLFNIDHQFGSDYFQEQLVLDFDGEESILQLFGTKSFITILKLLATPSDLITFFKYYQYALINHINYRLESILVRSFLHSKSFYQPALQIEDKLIELKILDKHDNRLVELTETSDAKKKDDLISRMKEYSDLWERLIKSATARQLSKNKTLSKEAQELLIKESLYTRMRIIEDIFADGRVKDKDIRGQISYQHSYANFGRQYMLVVYASDPTSWLSRPAIQKEHLNMLINLNSQLQDPVMEDLILLGFDVTHQDDEDVDIEMDIFHLKAKKMSKIEEYLHNQVLTLKAELYQQQAKASHKPEE